MSPNATSRWRKSVAPCALLALAACAPHFEQVEYRNESPAPLRVAEVYRLPGEARLFTPGALWPSTSKTAHLSSMPLPDSLRLVWHYATDSTDGPEQVARIPVPKRGEHEARLLIRRTVAELWVAEWVDVRAERREFEERMEKERARPRPPD